MESKVNRYFTQRLNWLKSLNWKDSIKHKYFSYYGGQKSRYVSNNCIIFRDNAVYRSNSFKFERRGPLPPEAGATTTQAASVQQVVKNVPEKLASKLDQVCNVKKPSRRQTKALVKEVILNLYSACSCIHQQTVQQHPSSFLDILTVLHELDILRLHNSWQKFL